MRIRFLILFNRLEAKKNKTQICFYLVRGTSSLWSNVTGEDLLRTEGVKVTKASVLLVGEQVKSEVCALAERPLDWLE